jgi:hypothetical protein
METDQIELMKCRNCKFCSIPKCPELEHAVFRCSKEISDDRSIVQLESSCFNGLFEKLENSEIKEVYYEIINILKEFIETSEENYQFIALWILGTHFHDYFQTYPYLFINAMKGSGKSRLLKLIKTLSWHGDMLASLSEAVLFRTSGTLCIDEFEEIGGKDKNSLRELLNTAYKRGGKVKRMKKRHTVVGDEQVVEEFSTFRPIAIANIWGMEEVLGDRCLNIVLEKSSNSTITRKIENFENNPKIAKIIEKIAKIQIQCRLCRVVTQKNIYEEWNNYLNITTLTTHTTLTTLTTFTTQTTQNDTNITFFDKIIKTDLDGRNLELLFPLFLIAEEIGVIDIIISIGVKISHDKKEEDINESSDVLVYRLVSNQTTKDWIKVSDLVNSLSWEMKNEETDKWLNAKWMGKCLKRLNLLIDKKRLSDGRVVKLNIEKAKEKLKIFER